MGRLGVTGWVLAIALAVFSGCNTAPTLPLPPPVVDVGAPNLQGLVRVSGEVVPRAFVYVFNQRLELGVITRADDEGLFEVEVRAEPLDVLWVWQELDGETGERKETRVPEADGP